MKKRFFLYLGALLLLASAAVALNGLNRTSNAADVDNSPDCDTVAIIKCGAYSKQAVLNKMHGDVTKTFSALGISRSDVQNAHFVSGIVWRDGRVTVNGKTVATNAMTASRNYKCAHRITSTTCTMSPSHFVTAGQTALVAMKGDTFDFAVIKPCGNPVKATPKKPQPKPQYACTDLTTTRIDRDTYRFRATATAKNGAAIVGYRFNFGDHHSKQQSSRTVNHTYAKAGKYTVTVQALVKVNGKIKAVSGKHCSVQVTVKPKPKVPLVQVCNQHTGEIISVPKSQAGNYVPVNSPKCQPKPPQPKPTCETKPEMAKCQPEQQELPETGPTGLISGALGLGTLGSAGYYFRDSRRQLLAKLLKR